MEFVSAHLGGIRQRISSLIAGRGVMRAMLAGVATVAVLTLVAKAASFFKDAAVAYRFGTADSLDAFLLSFSFLSFLAAVIGGGLPESFLPAYSGLKHKKGVQRAQRLAIQVNVWAVMSLSLAAMLLYFCAPHIIEFTGRGFSTEKKNLAINAFRALLPFMVFYGLTFQLSSWLHAEKCFALAATAPLLPPTTIILCLLVSGSNASIDTLVLGVTAGVFMQLAVLALALRRRTASKTRNCFTHWEPANRIVLRNAVPYILGSLIMNSAVIIDQAMAAWLESGSVSILSYSEKVCGIVLALTATAASEAVFPFFADTVARCEWVTLKRHLLQITGVLLLVALPLAAVLIVFAPQVVGLLFERGSFSPEDTAKVANVMRFAAMQIPFYIMGVIASRVAVSMQATRFTLCASIGAMTCNVAFNLLLMPGMGVAGIALSTALVHLLSAAALYIFIFHRLKRLNQMEGKEGG